jgi:iron complex outermembrane receptor protein
MFHLFERKNLPLAVLLASGLATGSATAAQLEEVIVTAQKRTESLQDIPIAVSAYDAEAIEKMRPRHRKRGLYRADQGPHCGYLL